eukprot:TRINITY_DN31016_c0_g1_i1.p1 TRINITY_DN31016_c0_g1~~TRINITY_DN31016_c0_g1_i1.p1  ORF type:complete len:366 (-),score=54.89 TRINITY_DN31016_c0_g1_i1:40-1110(-)
MPSASCKAATVCACGCFLLVGIILWCVFLPGTVPYFFLALGTLIFVTINVIGWVVFAGEVFIDGYQRTSDSARSINAMINELPPHITEAVFGIIAALTFPITLPLLCAVQTMRKADGSAKKYRKHVAVAILVIGWVGFGIALAYIMLWLCIASADTPCTGTPDVPTEFILNQSVMSATRTEFTVNDMNDKTVGHRRYVSKRVRRCSAPGAPFKYTQTMEYRDEQDRVTIWADMRAIYLRDPSAPWEIWDVRDCQENLLFTIEERLFSKLSGWWNEWTIRDPEGTAVAICDRFQLWVSMEIDVKDPRTNQIVGSMIQEAFQLKFRWKTTITNTTSLPPYMYGFMGLLTKRALDEHKK